MRKEGIAALCWVMAVALLVFVIRIQANDHYNQGSHYAGQIKSQGIEAIKEFKPERILPNYNANPQEKNHYGWVTAPITSLNSQGYHALNQTAVGRVITEARINNPAEKLSMEAPFIAAGVETQKKAEQVIDSRFLGCQPHSISQVNTTRHICSRNMKVEQTCTRTATITGDWINAKNETDVIIDSTQLIFSPYGKPFGNGNNRNNGARTVFTVPTGVNGRILSATMRNHGHDHTYMMMQILGVEINISNGIKNFWPTITTLTSGQKIPINIILSSGPQGTTDFYNERKGKFTAVLRIETSNKKFMPNVAWNEMCPFNKSEGIITSTTCIESGGNKTIFIEGRSYIHHSPCWMYKDTYLTQSADDGSCEKYAKNPVCTVAIRQCDYSLDDFCLHENVTYSCEHKTSGRGMLCGGKFFCTDGSCVHASAEKNNKFAQVASQLAAVAATGKEIAESNGQNINIFTGQPHACKKFAAGFNNCCQDSGWGNDLKLAHCSSEEKALGQAKARELTVDVGEYCSKKVLGVCLEKKRSYCLFDSKLAQIVQQQGRQWQLGLGFGHPSAPDCSGISVEQLQKIKFDHLDFSSFSADLQKGSVIPEDNALLKSAQQQIQQQISSGIRSQ